MSGHVVAMARPYLRTSGGGGDFGARRAPARLTASAASCRLPADCRRETRPAQACCSRPAFAPLDCERDIVELFGIPDRPGGARRRGRRRARGRRQHREHARGLARARHRPRPARGMGAWRRPRRRSAGANCWFEACVTDSFSAGWTASATASASSQAASAPTSTARSGATRLHAPRHGDGFPPGIACDDGAAAVYRGTELVEVVAERHGPLGYRVSATAIEPLPTRVLP